MFHGTSTRGPSRYACKHEPDEAGNARPGPHVTRHADTLDTHVVRTLLVYLNQPGMSSQLVPDNTERVAELRDQARVLRARLDDLAAAFAEGELTRDQHRAARSSVADKLAGIEAGLADTMATSDAAPLLAVANPDNPSMIEAAWNALSLDAQRAIVGSLMEVTVHGAVNRKAGFNPEDVTITWKTDQS